MLKANGRGTLRLDGGHRTQPHPAMSYDHPGCGHQYADESRQRDHSNEAEN
ncbi:hypothetical protein N9189_02980 [Pirellulaceae bacterium]|nr:hypothetical protein [Pirellulaceae bacterium]